MEQMSCCCLTFNQMDVDLVEEINHRIKQEMIEKRRFLWFHLGSTVPEASDVGVPPIHYHEMVEPVSFTMPIVMETPKEADKVQFAQTSQCASSCPTCLSVLKVAVNSRGKVKKRYILQFDSN